MAENQDTINEVLTHLDNGEIDETETIELVNNNNNLVNAIGSGNMNGVTLLQLAFENGFYNLANVLLDNHVNIIPPEHEQPYLCILFAYNNTHQNANEKQAMFKSILEYANNNLTPEQKNEFINGQYTQTNGFGETTITTITTPLYCAIRSRLFLFILDLLNNGANVNALAGPGPLLTHFELFCKEFPLAAELSTDEERYIAQVIINRFRELDATSRIPIPVLHDTTATNLRIPVHDDGCEANEPLEILESRPDVEGICGIDYEPIANNECVAVINHDIVDGVVLRMYRPQHIRRWVNEHWTNPSTNASIDANNITYRRYHIVPEVGGYAHKQKITRKRKPIMKGKTMRKMKPIMKGKTMRKRKPIMKGKTK